MPLDQRRFGIAQIDGFTENRDLRCDENVDE